MVLTYNQELYQGKRLRIQHAQMVGTDFDPKKTIMLKNLPKSKATSITVITC